MTYDESNTPVGRDQLLLPDRVFRIDTPDELSPDLRGYVEFGSGDDPWLIHPYCIMPFPLSTYGAPLTDWLKGKQEQADACLRAGEVERYLLWHERPYRMNHLLDLVADGHWTDATGAEFWRIAARAWTNSGLDEADPVWRAIMSVSLADRDEMTSFEDRDALASMPNTLTLYRGVQGRTPVAARRRLFKGWSWTLDPSIATIFSSWKRPHDHVGRVYEVSLPRRLALAYLTARGEAEIVIDPVSARYSAKDVREVAVAEEVS